MTMKTLLATVSVLGMCVLPAFAHATSTGGSNDSNSSSAASAAATANAGATAIANPTATAIQGQAQSTRVTTTQQLNNLSLQNATSSATGGAGGSGGSGGSVNGGNINVDSSTEVKPFSAYTAPSMAADVSGVAAPGGADALTEGTFFQLPVVGGGGGGTSTRMLPSGITKMSALFNDMMTSVDVDHLSNEDGLIHAVDVKTASGRMTYSFLCTDYEDQSKLLGLACAR